MRALAHTFTSFVLPLVLVVTGCATTKGKVTAGRYYAPSSNFNMTVPNFVQPRIQDDYDESGGYVSFIGQLGGLSSVFYERLPAEVKAIASDPNRQESVYRAYLHEQAMPNIFRRASPQSSLLHEEVLGAGADKAYFAVVMIPEASNSFDVKANRRFDSVRGLLIFIEGAYLYMLTEETGHTIEWRRSVIDRLRETKGSMTLAR